MGTGHQYIYIYIFVCVCFWAYLILFCGKCIVKLSQTMRKSIHENESVKCYKIIIRRAIYVFQFFLIS
jgi:hypothetical protein